MGGAPNAQMREELNNKVINEVATHAMTNPPTPAKSISESPALPPVPPASRVSKPEDFPVDAEQSDENDDECSDEDEEILRVTSDGINVEITSTKTDDLESPGSPESPIIPSVIEKTSYTSGSQNSSGSEENPSADDERSRDGDRKINPEDQGAHLVDCTPRTRKKVEHFRQGLAARRIQRTWKHFYEELEERKEVRDELPAPLVQGMC